ncbi:MAG: cysteine desulfurase [Acidobacteria bacterium]|nr:cysteine desulfurase [Acidobacteriota bacterium]
MTSIYLDYNATSPLDKEVLEAMLPYLTDNFANSISFHSFGQAARKGLEEARNQVAALVNCLPSEVIFTGGGTESNNSVIRGVARSRHSLGNHIITSQIEHPSIIKCCKELELEGFETTFLPVNGLGQIDITLLERSITDKTILISIMHANNEVGTIQPISEIGKVARKKGIYFHTDTAQSISKLPIDIQEMSIDMMTVAAHKFYGPKGVGALIVRQAIDLAPYMLGAGHENGRRAGTVNVAGAVGLGKACEIAKNKGENIINKVKANRDLFHKLLTNSLENVILNGHPTERLPNTLNLSFRGFDGQELLIATDIAASLGAACHTTSRQASSVLSAMGLSAEDALGAVRFSFGKYVTEEQAIEAANRIIKFIKK